MRCSLAEVVGQSCRKSIWENSNTATRRIIEDTRDGERWRMAVHTIRMNVFVLIEYKLKKFFNWVFFHFSFISLAIYSFPIPLIHLIEIDVTSDLDRMSVVVNRNMNKVFFSVPSFHQRRFFPVLYFIWNKTDKSFQS